MMDGPPPRILLVEDSDTQALQFRRVLEGEGFAVERARTAEDALERLNDTLPDLLLVDYRLPGMNGDELVRTVRQAGATRTLPVLMLTGDDAVDVERQGLDSGANAYVPKTAGRELIVSRMRSLLRQRRTAAPHDRDAGPAFRAPRLLLVEEGATYRALLTGLLASDGYVVEGVADADAALVALQDAAFDCVVVGQAVDGDAFGACARLEADRAARSGGHALVQLSDDMGGATVRSALAAGADDVVPREGERDMLLVRMRAIIRRKLARDEEAAAAERERRQAVALAQAKAEAEVAEALAAANRELAGANARLRDTQAQLVQSAKMASLGELVAGIAHEINNPLAFILAHQATVERSVAVALAADGDPAERQQRLEKASERLRSIRGGLSRIQELVVKLRRFSRLDDGEISQIDVPEAIDAVLTLLGPRLGESRVVERRYGPVRMLECSAALVNQVVMNIIANAADATDATTGEIEIETTSDDDAFVIRIADNGPGIPRDRRERIFEPFYTTKDVGSGTGLGLAIAYGVVRSHGGTLSVGVSAKGGALFTIAVPHARK